MSTKGSSSAQGDAEAVVDATPFRLVTSTESVPPSSVLSSILSYPSPGWPLDPARNMCATRVLTWPFLAHHGVRRKEDLSRIAVHALTNLDTTLEGRELK